NVDLSALAGDPAIAAAHAHVNTAAATYRESRTEGNFAQLHKLLHTAEMLRKTLLTAEDSIPGTAGMTATTYKAAAAEQPRVSTGHPTAPSVLLRHLDETVSRYLESDKSPADFISLHVALQRYDESLRAQPLHLGR